MNGKTFASYSFGCRVNHAEREEIDRQMGRAGFFNKTEKPDIFIINTCSVTHKAEREARQLIYQTRKNNPQIKIVVTGCSATYWLKTGQYKSLPVDLFVDNTNKEYLVSLLTKNLKNPPHTRKQIQSDKFLDSGRLMIKIQDGCHRFCSFCIVPYLRGLPKSRLTKEIVEKINNLEKGMHEAVLTAINTEAYGKDTGESFLGLVNAVLRETKIARLSFGSVHPWSITDEFINYYRSGRGAGKMVKYFHIPLQSGSNKILSLMKRCHTREDMMERVKKLAEVRPKTFIATDIIVGFLEESSVDFEDTYRFLEESPIAKFHVFRFSKRQMTAAYYLSKRLKEPSENDKKKRSQALRELSAKKLGSFMTGLVGYKSHALFLAESREGYQEVLLDNQIPAFIRADRNLAGKLKAVTIESYKSGRLFGKIV